MNKIISATVVAVIFLFPLTVSATTIDFDDFSTDDVSFVVPVVNSTSSDDSDDSEDDSDINVMKSRQEKQQEESTTTEDKLECRVVLF